MEETSSVINQLKEIISKQPDVLSALGFKKAGRPKGAKSSTVVEPGKMIEVIQPSETISNEEPIPISATQAKKMLKRPRNYSEETKKKMLENLQKGREKLKAQKAEKEAAFQKSVDQAKREVVIKKYIVKPLQRKGEGQHSKLKKQKIMDVDKSEEDSSDSSVHATTDYESDADVYKKLKRKERLIKKANKIQQMATQHGREQKLPASRPVKPAVQPNPYNPFF